MSARIYEQVIRAVLRAFRLGASECRIFGIVLRIQHAHHEDYQVILPNGEELCRLVGNWHHVRVLPS